MAEMLGKMSPANGGSWVRYDNFGPPLAAYADDLASGPITILWQGSVDVPSLRKFVSEAIEVVSRGERVVYRTRILSGTDQEVVYRTRQEELKSFDAPPLGRLGQAAARFVRFECLPANSAARRDTNPVLIAWAILDKAEENTQESIGVYLRREHMKVLRPQIESFVIDTAVSKSFPNGPEFAATRSRSTKNALDALSLDLS
jgi:hypothetical protein